VAPQIRFLEAVNNHSDYLAIIASCGIRNLITVFTSVYH